MGSAEFLKWAKATVMKYAIRHLDLSDPIAHKPFEVYVVWYSKTLQNHKALLSTSLADGMYYEFTYNGDKDEAYLDAYKKWENKVVRHD